MAATATAANMVITGRPVSHSPGHYIPTCPLCTNDVMRADLLGLPMVALQCGACDVIYLINDLQEQCLQLCDYSNNSQLSVAAVAKVLPGTAKQWSDGTMVEEVISGTRGDSCSTFAQPTAKTPQTSLQPVWDRAVPGPLRRSHFLHGSVFLQLEGEEEWMEVAAQGTLCTRPAVPGHGVVFKLAHPGVLDIGSAEPGAAIAVPLCEWWDVIDDTDWITCTNCSRSLDPESYCLEGCYSSHLLLTCLECDARMLFDVPGDDDIDDNVDDDQGTRIMVYAASAGSCSVFLPAKGVAYVRQK